MSWSHWCKAFCLFSAFAHVSKALLSFWKMHRKFRPDITRKKWQLLPTVLWGVIFRMPVAAGWPWVDCFVFVSRTGSGTPHYRHAARPCFWSSRAVTSYPAYLDISCLPFSLLLTLPSFPILWKQHSDKKKKKKIHCFGLNTADITYNNHVWIQSLHRWLI